MDVAKHLQSLSIFFVQVFNENYKQFNQLVRAVWPRSVKSEAQQTDFLIKF